MNIVLLGYSPIRREIAESIARYFSFRHLNRENLRSTYEDVVFDSPKGSRPIPDSDLEVLTQTLTACQCENFLLDGIPDRVEDARSIVDLLRSRGKSIDYVIFVPMKFETAVSNIANGDPKERNKIASILTEEKTRILELSRFYNGIFSERSYAVGNPRSFPDELEDEIIHLLVQN